MVLGSHIVIDDWILQRKSLINSSGLSLQKKDQITGEDVLFEEKEKDDSSEVYIQEESFPTCKKSPSIYVSHQRFAYLMICNQQFHSLINPLLFSLPIARPVEGSAKN